MRILTQIQRTQAMSPNSQRMIIIRAIIGMALYWPLWRFNVWIIRRGLHNLGPLGKVLFYINLFYLLINWYLIANRKPEVDRETVKFSLFIIIVLILMELPTWIYVFHRG